MADLADEKYVALATFTRDGRRKESPVWIADLGDGTVGFTTGSGSWKVKRIRNTPKVELTPSNMKGVVKQGAATRTGTASTVFGADAAPVQAAIKAKYGMQVTAMQALAKIARVFGRGDDATDAAVTISLD